MLDARIDHGQVDLYDASSGMYRRTIRPGGTPTDVRADGDELAITLQDGTVHVYSSQGLYKRTIEFRHRELLKPTWPREPRVGASAAASRVKTNTARINCQAVQRRAGDDLAPARPQADADVAGGYSCR